MEMARTYGPRAIEALAKNDPEATATARAMAAKVHPGVLPFWKQRGTPYRLLPI